MKRPLVETGQLAGRFPFVRMGHGPQTLVILPGINDALGELTHRERFAAWLCGLFAEERTTCLLSRPPGLAEDFSIESAAAEYARVIAAEFGRVDVLGLSMGSAIAQALAAEHAEVVHRVVLALAGARMHPASRPIYERFISLARAGAWRELYLALIEETYGPSRRSVLAALLPESDDVFTRAPTDPHDFIASVQACMTYDTRDRLHRITVPTLVVGGAEDRLMPRALFRELATGIPGASQHLIQGAGHGAVEQAKDEFVDVVLRFLKG